MPKDLPGLYWDEARNRYFPISSRPKTQTSHQTSSISSSGPSAGPSGSAAAPNTRDSARRSKTKHPCVVPSHVALSYHERARHQHDAVSSKIAASFKAEYSPVRSIGKITTLASSVSSDGFTSYFVGDTSGWLYKSTGNGEDSDADADELAWAAEFNLRPSSEISSISTSGQRCVATCSGTTARIAVINDAQTTLFSVNGIHDAWASFLSDRSLVIGAEKKAVYIPDIDIGPPMTVMDTQSDIFSVFMQESQIYTGARNGDIMRFDVRTEKRDGQKIFSGRFGPAPTSSKHAQPHLFKNRIARPRSSVVHLGIIREWQMLVSHMDGELGTYDLRFLRETNPVQMFTGHVNSLTRQLGIAVDPCENLLFAAGEDRRIRAWSITTGELLQAPISLPASSGSGIPAETPLLERIFEEPVAALKVSETRGRLYLWATAPRGLHKYTLDEY
ncbi:hypothetical protein HGRIS_006005 [Hohenbuehelia grisea]|uniref:WD40 repeat-like protein n=1 Tax=Hohenbuehelia grisea TaxID=104357 RepID=A0ABR3K0J1_9AGAR